MLVVGVQTIEYGFGRLGGRLEDQQLVHTFRDIYRIDFDSERNITVGNASIPADKSIA